MMGYYGDVDTYLDMIEQAAKAESYLLLTSSFQLSTYMIQCGLSPARQFSPSIILKKPFHPAKISFSTYEWATFIDSLYKVQQDFFEAPLPCFIDESDPAVTTCGDYITITKFVFDGVKMLYRPQHMPGGHWRLASSQYMHSYVFDECVYEHI